MCETCEYPGDLLLDFLEFYDVPIHVEQPRVVRGLVCEVDGDGRQYEGREPRAVECLPCTLFGHLFARTADNVVDDEEDDRDYDRHTQTASADDSAQWCSDQEEDDDRHRKRQFLVPFDLAAVELVERIFGLRFVEREHRPGVACGRNGLAPDSVLGAQVESRQGVEGIHRPEIPFFYDHRIVSVGYDGRIPHEDTLLEQRVIGSGRRRIDLLCQRVDFVLQLGDVLVWALLNRSASVRCISNPEMEILAF